MRASQNEESQKARLLNRILMIYRQITLLDHWMMTQGNTGGIRVSTEASGAGGGVVMNPMIHSLTMKMIPAVEDDEAGRVTIPLRLQTH